jgi:hypothetical protein
MLYCKQEHNLAVAQAQLRLLAVRKCNNFINEGNMDGNKKLVLLRVLHILQKHSDLDHPLTQDQIVELLDIHIQKMRAGKNMATG